MSLLNLSVPVSAEWIYFTTPQTHFRLPATSEWQRAQSRLDIAGGRTSSQLGNEVLWLGRRGVPYCRVCTLGFGTGHAIEIGNFSAGETWPWQMWRAAISAGLWLEYQDWLLTWLSSDLRSVNEVAFAHESQHLSDVDSYRSSYTTLAPGEYFDNRSLRSFEALRIRSFLEQPLGRSWVFSYVRTGRFFTPPLNPHAPFAQRIGINYELRLSYLMNSANRLSIAAGFDYVRANYNDLDVFRAEKRNYFGYRAEMAWTHNTPTHILYTMALTYQSGHGHQFDFVEYIPEWPGRWGLSLRYAY